MFICTSHEEGLGLPLLEAQYAGLPIVAPDDAVFREVLNKSGIFIDPRNVSAAATQIAAAVSNRGWRSSYVARGAENLVRWNAQAAADRDGVISLIASLARQPAFASSNYVRSN